MAQIPVSQWYPTNSYPTRNHYIRLSAVLSWLTSTMALILGLTLLKKALVLLLMNLYEFFVENNMLKL